MKYFDRFDCICRVSIGSRTWIVPFFKWYTSIICNLFVWFVIVYWICIVDCLHSFKLIFDLHVGLMYVSEVLINLLGFWPIILTTMVKKKDVWPMFSNNVGHKVTQEREKKTHRHIMLPHFNWRKPDERQHCPCNSLLFYCNTQHTHKKVDGWQRWFLLAWVIQFSCASFENYLYIDDMECNCTITNKVLAVCHR